MTRFARFHKIYNEGRRMGHMSPRDWFLTGWDAALKERDEVRGNVPGSAWEEEVERLGAALQEMTDTKETWFHNSEESEKLLLEAKEELRTCKNERDTWQGRHLTLKQAIITINQAHNLDVATYS